MRITPDRATAPLILCRPCATCTSLHERILSAYRAYPYSATDVSTRGQIYAEAPKLVPTPQTMFGGRRDGARVTDRDYARCIRMLGGYSGRREGDRKFLDIYRPCIMINRLSLLFLLQAPSNRALLRTVPFFRGMVHFREIT